MMAGGIAHIILYYITVGTYEGVRILGGECRRRRRRAYKVNVILLRLRRFIIFQ